MNCCHELKTLPAILGKYADEHTIMHYALCIHESSTITKLYVIRKIAMQSVEVQIEREKYCGGNNVQCVYYEVTFDSMQILTKYLNEKEENKRKEK